MPDQDTLGWRVEFSWNAYSVIPQPANLEISLSATVDSSAMTALIQQHVSAVVSSLEVEVYLHSDLTGHVSVGPFPFQMLIGNFVVLPVPRQDV